MLMGKNGSIQQKKFFVPIKALSKIFRAVFFELLERALKRDELIIPEKGYSVYKNLKKLKNKLYQQLWHVHIKKTFKGAGQVISYLGEGILIGWPLTIVVFYHLTVMLSVSVGKITGIIK